VLNLEHLLKIVLWVSLCVIAIDLLLVVFILRRRWSRWLYFRKKDAVARQFAAPVHSFLVGELPPDDLVATLETLRAAPGRDAIRELLLDGLEGSQRKPVTEVLFRLGYVERWAREAFGRSRANELLRHIVVQEELPPAPRRRFDGIRRLRLFCVKRARAVNQLGHLDTAFSRVFTREALSDPSPYVIRANVAAMGHNQQAYQVPILLELLRQAVKASSDLPVASVKTALVRYPISYLDQFPPFLNDPDPLYRFVVVDSIRQVCEAARFGLNSGDFPEGLYQWFVDKASQDESVDVRARSARVIRHFHDAPATLTLRGMMLDKNEFVRLHTVRACADPFYSELIPDIIGRLIDPRWRVREASVKTLATFGAAGRQQLARYFLDSTDQFASEQIIEEMQRGGIIAGMLPALSGEDGEFTLTMGVCSKMVRLGKTSLLIDLLGREMRLSRWAPAGSSAEPITRSAQKARARLLDLLLASPTVELVAALQSLAGRKEDQLSVKAQAALESHAAGAAAAAKRAHA